MARIIIGFMGSGKSTISSLLDKDYIDMDALITERIGMSIADFFEKEPSLPEAETALEKLSASLGKRSYHSGLDTL